MIQSFLIARVGQELFGVPAERILEIAPALTATPLPFVPDFVDGVVSVGGRILPQIDLLRRLGRDRTVRAEESELVVVSAGAGDYALAIDHAVTLAAIDPDAVSPIAGTEAAIQRFVLGEFEWQGRHVPILDADAFALEDVSQSDNGLATAAPLGRLSGTDRGAAQRVEGFAGILVEIAGGPYALPLGAVREVVETGTVRSLPHAPSALRGLFDLRGRPLALFALDEMLGLPSEAGSQAILVDGVGGLIGLGVAKVIGLRRFPEEPKRARADMGATIERYLIDQSGRMVMIVDPVSLLSQPALSGWRDCLPVGTGLEEAAQGRIETRRFLSMSVAGEAWALDLDRVERVAEYRMPQDTPAQPGPHAQIHGIVDIGGEILPVIDLARTLGRETPEQEISPQSAAYVVARLPQGNAALLVGQLHRILTLPVGEIERLPDARRHMVEGIGRLDGRLISILSIDGLLAA